MLEQTGINPNIFLQFLGPALIAGIVALTCSIITSTITMRIKMKEINETFRQGKLSRDIENKGKLRVRYLNPIQIAAEDLRDRLRDIDDRLHRNDRLLRNTMEELKSRVHENQGYIHWANGFGHYSLSTLFITTVYFAHSSKLRSDLPMVELNCEDDKYLLQRMSQVRESLGGQFGIWETLQDSFGNYIRKPDRGLMNYREFCNELYDETKIDWYMRLIEFYVDLDQKTSDERRKIINSLQELINFLSRPPIPLV